MARRISVEIPLNRVEGDLEVFAEIEDGLVVEARCSGTMYRGLENLLLGRSPLDSLVITPRICGICSTSHLMTAAQALEAVAGITPPAAALRLRNATLIAEQIQSDLRHTFLMYTVDFVNQAYQHNPLFGEAMRRYEPFKGETVVQVIQHTKHLLEIIAIVGGQWPHSSYVVPGGLVSLPKPTDLLDCRLRLQEFSRWYEDRILGCSLERWAEVQSLDDLDAWLDESPGHRDSDVGFFLRYARSLGMDRTGAGHGAFLSFGSMDLPQGNGERLIPAGFTRGIQRPQVLDLALIAEEVACSWYVDYAGGKHPFDGETRPQASGREGGKYSWAKAPRYDGGPAETGPLAEALIGGHALLVDLVRRQGSNSLVRQLARLIRPAGLLRSMEEWLGSNNSDEEFYRPPGEIPDGRGAGVLQAARGALGHWLKIKDGVISGYQVVTPTAWNVSPRDAAGVPGPLEQAMLGTLVADLENPIELAHVVRSFDPCLVCTVHMVSAGRSLARIPLRPSS